MNSARPRYGQRAGMRHCIFAGVNCFVGRRRCLCTLRTCIPRRDTTTSGPSVAPRTAWRCVSRCPMPSCTSACVQPTRWRGCVFELLEQIRVEAMAPVNMPGLVRNLRHRHEQWSRAFHHSGLTETAKGILLYTVAQVCRARVTAQPVVDATEGVIEATRMALAPVLGECPCGPAPPSCRPGRLCAACPGRRQRGRAGHPRSPCDRRRQRSIRPW